MLERAAWRELPSGATLIRQGEDPCELHLVVEGRFKVATASPHGPQLLLRFMEPGDLVGCAAFFRRIVDALERCLPRGERATIPGASHTVPGESPQAWGEAVVAFLARH